jgi:DNA topoisomerase-1
VPSWTAFAVVRLLEEHFKDLVDYGFTARMEEELDLVASGQLPRSRALQDFYYGTKDDDDFPGLEKLVNQLGEIDAKENSSFPIGDSGIVLRVGKFGPYLQRGEDERASVPPDLAPDELTPEKAEAILIAPSSDRELGVHPETGLTIMVKTGRYGPYVTEILAEDTKEKPKTASLFKSMAPETITFEDALQLMSLPRIIGKDPKDGEVIQVQNGRYGPYMSKEKDTRSLEAEEEIFTINLEEALAKFAEPKRRRGAVAKPPLKDFGEDPNTGRKMVLKEGRFGPYVTDGETNAGLRPGDVIEEITADRASELLFERRARGPVEKRPRKKAAAKKSAKPAKKKKTGESTKQPVEASS